MLEIKDTAVKNRTQSTLLMFKYVKWPKVKIDGTPWLLSRESILPYRPVLRRKRVLQHTPRAIQQSTRQSG